MNLKRRLIFVKFKKINPTKDEEHLKQAQNIIQKCINGELHKCI